MIMHQWSGDCAYMWHLNPLNAAAIIALPLEGPTSAWIKTDNERWLTDVDLFAEYMQLKLDRQIQMRSYVRQQPQVMALIRDYVFCLLRSKPANVLDFSIKHFTCQRDDISQNTVKFKSGF